MATAGSAKGLGGSLASSADFFEGKLLQLQNLVKRDPVAYREEFEMQFRHYKSERNVFLLNPSKPANHFGELVSFLSQVAQCYLDTFEPMKDFPSQIMTLLKDHYASLDRSLRKTLVEALVLMRNRGHIEPIQLLRLFFMLFRCHDKALRKLLTRHIVSDLKNINKNARNQKVNRALQNFMSTMLADSSSIAAKKSLDVMIELYRRRVWTDSRTVNVIAEACISDHTALIVGGIHFFLGIDVAIDADEDEEDEGMEELIKEAEKVQEQAPVAKKTKARQRRRAKVLKSGRRARIAQERGEQRKIQASGPRFPALQLLNDPQTFVEKLFRKLRSSKQPFDVRCLMMNLVSRLIGFHELMCLNFYSFMQRYMQPHQRDVTKLMAYVVQACHNVVPPDEVAPVVKIIADNFVTDRCSGEVIAVGINTIREMITRMPLLLDEEAIEHIWLDLVQYKKYRGDKNVNVAARSALNQIRELRPEILQRKDRGKDVSMAMSRGKEAKESFGSTVNFELPLVLTGQNYYPSVMRMPWLPTKTWKYQRMIAMLKMATG